MFQARFFDNKRQRPNNPTYISSNIQNCFNNSYATNTIQAYTNASLMQSNHSYQPLPKYTSFQNPEMNTQKTFKRTKDVSYQKQSATHRAFSNLSKYGSNSLSNLHKQPDREVYQKQLKRYNIVTNNDRQTSETIKRYPKYHLQTLDDAQKRRKALLAGNMGSYSKFNQSLLENKRQGSLYSNPVLANLSQQKTILKKTEKYQYNMLTNDVDNRGNL